MEKHVNLEHQPTNPTLIKCLLGEGHFLHLLKDERYEPLKAKLIDLSQSDVSNIQVNTLKKSLNGFKVEKWLPIIASDLFKLYQNKPQLFRTRSTQKFYSLYIEVPSKNGPHSYSLAMWTEQTFNVGDELSWGFLEVKFRWTFFKITEVFKSLEKGEVITYLTLENI